MESSSNHMRFPLHRFVRGLKIKDSSRWKSSLSSSLGCGVLRNIFLIMNGLEYWEALCSRKSRPQQNVRKPPKCAIPKNEPWLTFPLGKWVKSATAATMCPWIRDCMNENLFLAYTYDAPPMENISKSDVSLFWFVFDFLLACFRFAYWCCH